MTKSRKLFVNISVADLPRTKQFFAQLGFEYNKQFTDDNAACLIVGSDSFFMLLRREFFQTFTKRQICDTRTHTEGLFAISCDSRDAVDVLADKALSIGASPASDAQDHGFMYVRSFYDLDGHHWEVMWMDPNAVL
jgi:predicted lactoylglutathione lyase